MRLWKAREMIEATRAKGDNEGADTWLRIIVAIGELGLLTIFDPEKPTTSGLMLPWAVRPRRSIEGDRHWLSAP